MISADVNDLLKSLDSIQKEIERKLKFMAGEFAYYATEILTENTPIGQSDLEFYVRRNEIYSFYPVGPGMAKGSWDVRITKMLPGDLLRLTSGYNYMTGASASLSAVNYTMDTYYELGNSFYIYNKAPYMTKRNAIPLPPVDPKGLKILKPSVDKIVQILGTDLVGMFNRG